MSDNTRFWRRQHLRFLDHEFAKVLGFKIHHFLDDPEDSRWSLEHPVYGGVWQPDEKTGEGFYTMAFATPEDAWEHLPEFHNDLNAIFMAIGLTSPYQLSGAIRITELSYDESLEMYRAQVQGRSQVGATIGAEGTGRFTLGEALLLALIFLYKELQRG